MTHILAFLAGALVGFAAALRGTPRHDCLGGKEYRRDPWVEIDDAENGVALAATQRQEPVVNRERTHGRRHQADVRLSGLRWSEWHLYDVLLT